MSPTGGEGWRYGTGLSEGMTRAEPVVFAEMGTERVMLVAIQCTSWTRELFRGTSRSTMRRTHVPGPFSSAHHTGEEMVGRVAVSGMVLVAVRVRAYHLEGDGMGQSGERKAYQVVESTLHLEKLCCCHK